MLCGKGVLPPQFLLRTWLALLHHVLDSLSYGLIAVLGAIEEREMELKSVDEPSVSVYIVRICLEGLETLLHCRLQTAKHDCDEPVKV